MRNQVPCGSYLGGRGIYFDGRLSVLIQVGHFPPTFIASCIAKGKIIHVEGRANN